MLERSDHLEYLETTMPGGHAYTGAAEALANYGAAIVAPPSVWRTFNTGRNMHLNVGLLDAAEGRGSTLLLRRTRVWQP